MSVQGVLAALFIVSCLPNLGFRPEVFRIMVQTPPAGHTFGASR